MKWAVRQITLPLLIGVSLTGVCVGLYYFLYKKEEENVRETVALRDKIDRTIQIKVPRQHVPAIIGRQGTIIKDIEQRTSTRIRFNDDDVTIPDRICIIKGTSECVKLAEAMIKEIVENQPVIETYEMFIPQRVRSALLANRGDIIHTIQMSTRARIILEKGYSDDLDEKKRVIIKGSAEQIAAALYHIEDMVRESNKTQEKLEAGQSTRSPRKASPRNTTVVNVETQLQSEESHGIHESMMEVYVSAMDNPGQFWVQVIGSGILALDELVETMTSYYNDERNRQLHTLTDITIGQTVAAKFSFDNRWYRAEVISLVDDEQYEVFFVDYGDHEIINLTDVLELRTDFLSLRLQAIECSLANVKPKENDWSEEVCDRFSDLCWCAQWKVLIAKVRGYKERVIGQGHCRREGSPIPCVDLYDRNNNQDINIGKQLVLENLAVSTDSNWSSASTSLSRSKNSHDNASSPTPPMTNQPLVSPDDLKDTNMVNIVKLQKVPSKIIEEIDLTTTKTRKNEYIEEIDLVSPKYDSTRQFIGNEIQMNIHENGGGDHGQSNDVFPTISEWKSTSNIVPAGAESVDEDSDEFELS